MDPRFIERAEAHLGRALDLDGFRIASAEQISGNGLSRSVFKLGATSTREPEPRDYVLLLEQSTSPVAPNRNAEFAILRALADVPGVDVAPAFWVESDPEPLGAPFLLTGLLPGTTNPKALLKPEVLPQAKRLAEASFETLGRLAAVDVTKIDLGSAFVVPEAGDVWRIELERHAKIIRDADGADSPVTSAALRFLHRAPPPPPSKVSVVHGDYRLGNYLFEPSALTGVIDWEMVHLGDPVEDLAWSLLPLWEFAARPGLAGGFLTRAEAVGAWERASGLRADARSLAWWTVLCHVKAVGIWATSRHQFASSRQTGIWPALVGYAMVEKQESLMVEQLQALMVEQLQALTVEQLPAVQR